MHGLAESKSHTDAGIARLILDRALYNGAIDAKEALELANSQARHSREGGNPGLKKPKIAHVALDPRLRGDDDDRMCDD